MARSQLKRLEGEVSSLELLHQVPGRLRVRIMALYRDESRGVEIETRLRKKDHVSDARVNALTGTVLIQFDAVQLPDREALNLVEGLMHELGLDGQGAQKQVVLKHRAPRSRKPSARSSRTSGSLTALKNLAPGLSVFRRSGGTSAVERSTPSVSSSQAWFSASVQQVLNQLETPEQGLSAGEADRRLALYGANRLEEQKQRSALEIIGEQFLNIPVAMLGVSAVVSIATGGVADALVIAGVVVINAAIGYLTESQAEKTINALGKMTPSTVQVYRDGVKREILLEDVVMGDLLVLSPGAYIPADARIVNTESLTVDESALTGESLPVAKDHREIEQDAPLGERSNMVHMGTIVTGGNGTAVVTATGQATEIGLIQSMVGSVSPPDTPMQRELEQIGVKLATLSAGICAAVFGVGMLRGLGWLPMLNSSISLAVAAVPEGLPAVATTTLALGIRQMKKHQVLIRQLPAVESLGAVQTICLDKTGTLTMNQMKVVSVVTHQHGVKLEAGVFSHQGQDFTPTEQSDMNRLLEVVSLCSEVQLPGEPGIEGLSGSPTECALVEAAIHAGHDVAALRLRMPLLNMLHRSEERLYMCSTHLQEGEQFFLAVKGSPMEVMDLCSHYQVGDEQKPIDKRIRKRVQLQNDEMAGDALRVLGVAYGYTDSSETALPSDLIWLGLIGMEDVIRPGMAELMAEFHQAGIDTVMITGDQVATALSVGKRLGLSRNGDMRIIDSRELEQASPDELKEIVKGTTVFARVSPAHKLRIVQALQASGQVVAMTGDGINDGPALKAADIGVAMGKQGTDVARSVAGVVLQDDNMHTMITAVEQGRTIYGNIQKSLRFLLSSNLSEIQLMLASFAMGYGEALNPMQLLWINLVTDIFPALALSMEPPERDVLKQAPRDPGQPILGKDDIQKLMRESLTMTAGSMAVFLYSLSRYGVGAKASTNTFMTLTVAQFLQSITSRSESTSVLDRSRPSNPYLNLAIAGSLGVQALAVLLPPLRGLLRLTPIGPMDLAIILAGSVAPFVVNEGVKASGITRKRRATLS